MLVQTLVKDTLIAHLSHVRSVITSLARASRTAIASRLCSDLNLHNASSKPQISSCLESLGDMAHQGLIDLPAAKNTGCRTKSPLRLNAPVATPCDVAPRVDLLRDLRLRLVEDESQRRIWNELIITEHPLGMTQFAGCQIRYLIECESGILGAIGFSASALKLKSRDEWIGWDHSQRRAHLHRVVGMSRFLIRPSVRCENLASKVLSLAVESVARDFRARYNYDIWLLESFVDPTTHSGVSYRAANWLHVGQTAGRGRQDRTHQCSKTAKDIYIYVLDRRFRKRLGVSEYEPHPPLPIAHGLAEDTWARQEFGGADLGDKRLSERLITIAHTKGQAPGESYLNAVKGQSAPTSGFYRFVEQPSDSAISFDNIVGPHREKTLQRMNALPSVLCLHDTTSLNYDSLLACEDLGVIGKNQTSSTTHGLALHTSYVVSETEGLPLGILNAHCYAPELKPQHKGKKRHDIPIEEKDSFRWIQALEACTTLTKEIPKTQTIHVMDREADFFELFDHWRQTKRDSLVVRAQHDRKSRNEDTSLFERARNSAILTTAQVEIPRRSARPKKGKRKAQAPRQRRLALLTLRAMPVQIKPSRCGLNSHKEPVDVWILHVNEEQAPTDGSKPVEWFLLSALPIESPADATRIMEIYAKRWRIEDWHRILKTGCRIEEYTCQRSNRLERILAINIVIAWRIHLMILLGRELPELPVDLLFSDNEIKVLTLLAQRDKHLKEPTNLGQAIILVAQLGGYMARKHDGPPGPEVLWKGITDLAFIVEGYLLYKRE